MQRNLTSKHRPSISEENSKEGEARQSKLIERYLKEEAVTWKRVQAEPKLLLLGTSDSGKSTLLKQMKIMHGGGFPAEEIENSRKSIRASLLTNCRVILNHSAKISGNPVDQVGPLSYHQKFTDLVETAENDVTDFFDLVPSVIALWADEKMRQVFADLPQNSLPDTASYFMSQIERIGKKDFDPSNEVTSILFVVALSAYNQVMAEEDTTNRMADAISLFKSIAGHELLKRPSIILFMNKKDLYDEKIKTSPISAFFPDYSGISNNLTEGASNDAEGGIKYFEKKFMDVVEDKERYVISHATCATDTKAMSVIIGGIVAQIVSNLLSNSGLT